MSMTSTQMETARAWALALAIKTGWYNRLNMPDTTSIKDLADGFSEYVWDNSLYMDQALYNRKTKAMEQAVTYIAEHSKRAITIENLTALADEFVAYHTKGAPS